MATYLFPLRTAKRRARIKAAIESSCAEFEEAVIRADSLPSDAKDTIRRRKLVDYVRASFEKIKAKIDGPDFDSLEDQASDLARLRAFVLPFGDLAVEAQSSVSELRQWHVPQEAFSQAQLFLTQINRASEEDERVRAAFNELIAIYDYWAWYIDWYFDQLTIAAIALALVAVVSIGASVVALGRTHATLGFLLAGLGGTATSILIKLPPLSVYGDAASFWIRVVGRIGGGLVAASVGLGLLGSNAVNFSFGDTRISDALRCVQAAASEQAISGLPATTSFASTVTPADGGLNIDTAQPPIAGGTHSESIDARPRDPCGRSSILFILSIAILIGFSERALSSFEQAVFGSSSNNGPRPPPSEVAGSSPRQPENNPAAQARSIVAIAPSRLQGGVTIEPHASIPAPRELAGPGGSFKNPSPRGSA